MTDKIILSIDGFKSFNLPRKMDNPKFITLSMSVITLDDILQIDFKDSCIEDVICEIFSSVRSELKSNINHVPNFEGTCFSDELFFH